MAYHRLSNYYNDQLLVTISSPSILSPLSSSISWSLLLWESSYSSQYSSNSCTSNTVCMYMQDNNDYSYNNFTSFNNCISYIIIIELNLHSNFLSTLHYVDHCDILDVICNFYYHSLLFFSYETQTKLMKCCVKLCGQGIEL